MISKKMAKALSEQMAREFESAYIYLAMAGKAAEMNLKGASTWMQVQATEEMGHGMKFFKYLLDQQAETDFPAIAAPPVQYDSLTAIFRKTLEHERKVTAWISALMEQAVSEKDYATQIFLQWFVTEQVEEEANAAEILAQLEMIGDKPSALVLLDRHLGKRGEAKE